MLTLYDRIANQNLDRLAGLGDDVPASDGVLAFATTLLVLEVLTRRAQALEPQHAPPRGTAFFPIPRCKR